MIYQHKYKPRHYIPFITKSKLSLYKNSFLRGIYLIRRRQIKRTGFFKYAIIRATNIKWIANRRKINPLSKNRVKYTSPFPHNIGYGRPISFKRRYRENFYKKQQFRLFYGKFNEKILRRLLKNHKRTASSQTSIFFAIIESRLDVMFFRRRLIPTIYSCHQFIHHFGLEVNNNLENCPQIQVNIGDIISIPSLFWKSIFKLYFNRIYWRRWGIFIRGRRLLKKFKKFIIIFQPFSLSRKINNTNISTFIENTDKFSNKKINFYTRLLLYHKEFNLKYITTLTKKSDQSSDLAKWEKKVNQIKINKLKIYQQLQLTSSLRKNFLPRIFRFIKQNSFQGRLQSKQFDNNYDFDIHTKKIEIARKESEKEKKIKAEVKKKQNTFFNYSIIRINRRKTFFRLKTNYLKRIARNQRIIRKKNIHFFIPKHIQIDYRTLNIIKVETQKESTIYYPFRLSLNKLYSFYRSKGF